MDKKVKDVFFNIANDENKFCEAKVEEVKFSKKLNAVIISATSNDNIPLYDIEDFERKACKEYELNSFKIDYQYTGKTNEITVKNVENVILIVTKKYEYTRKIFENCKTVVDPDTKKIEITLTEKFSGFLSLKKIDKYINQCILVEYGPGYTVVIQDDPNAISTSEEGRPASIKLEDLVRKNAFNNENANHAPSFVSSAPVRSSDHNYPMRVKLTEEEKEERKLAKKPQPENVIYGIAITATEKIKITDINTNYERVCFDGEIFKIDSRELKSGKILLTLDITDYTSTIACKMFLDKEKFESVNPKLTKGRFVTIQGRPQFDTYAKELGIMINNINTAEAPEKVIRNDEAKEKRVELHLHTQMSAMDAVSSASDIIAQAVKWGQKSIAITDHGVAQSFPDAIHYITGKFGKLVKKEKGYPTTQEIVDAAPIKVLYGVEGYLTQDVAPFEEVPDTYCVFDLETTGFNPKMEKITEIAVCKVKDGEIIEEFTTFVNPEKNIPKNVQELTHITDDMVKNAPTIDEILPTFLEFTKGSILVAHNARFDISFISHFAKEQKLEFKPKVMDTLTMARELYTSVENHKLGTIAEFLGISLEGAHRAINDTRATAKVFLKMLEDAKKKGINELGYMYSEIEEEAKKLPYNHIILLAKNYVGLKNLYRLISYSHLTYFNKRPRIPRSLLNRYKEGLVIGSACERGELYQAVLENKTEEEIENKARFYDYLEIQPLGNNQFYLDQGKLSSKEDLININKKIIALGEKLNIPVVGTCDVHFLNPEDEIYRRIIMAGQGYSDADKQAPLYFRTTEEMLKEFDYLSPEKAYEIVVTNTNKVSDWCERISPISDEKCPPHIDGCEETIKEIAVTKAHELYGEVLPKIVEERLDKELESIIKNGFSVMYIIAQKLVWKSNEDGYLVGSRGSVGSSFVANMTGITEVNSLKPHYRCPSCKYSEFLEYGVKNGFDLPDKDCPKCGHRLDKDGMDIPFETFLGFNGDKEPDIDLNFSGEYQAKAHRYTEVIFGKGTTYKAGTIGTVADKTAYGFVLKYLEERNKTMLSPEINRIAQGCTGIKRTSGQHPGGIIVVPKGREIYEFCPVQHPADDPHSSIITTHFDYHSIDKNLLKLDILGHDDPTVIRMLQDITGIDPQKIPLDDPETMSIFSSTNALGLTKEQINSEVGTFGIPEFGTKFVRGMLIDTRPTTFEELIRISGLSHGTDVWLNNAQTLIEDGTCTLSDAICTRDDIMIYLIGKGLPPNPSFKIMESVRKGKGLTEEQEALMRENGVPDWYIDSCKKIKYMFPKAHAAAYVTMAFRIAWFKVHIPMAYYAAFFSIRADDFDSDFMLQGKTVVKDTMKEIDALGNAAGNKEKNMYPILEIVLEMYERNISFLPVDIYKSDATHFLVEKDGIRPPLSALTGFGEVDANKLVEARNIGRFTSIEQMAGAAKIGKVAVETLQKAGCLNGMPRSEQLDMFDLL
ncbi:MAG: PolC-type DNA polymerase III [Clostridia bacterium]|nr:PolC-type DNA polymerase III [Clostridia bacterium]